MRQLQSVRFYAMKRELARGWLLRRLGGMKRRHFISGSLAASAATSFAKAPLKPRPLLGYDNFAVRAMGWKAKELVDYAVKLKVDTVFITDLDAFESLEEKALAVVKNYADEKGVKIYLGTWSVCPTSESFNDKWGSAEKHLQLGILAKFTSAISALAGPMTG